MIAKVTGSRVVVEFDANLVNPAPSKSTGKTLTAAFESAILTLDDGRKLKVTVAANLPNPAFQKAA